MKLSPEILDLADRLRGGAGISSPLSWDRWLVVAESERVLPFLHRLDLSDAPAEVRKAALEAYHREGRDALLKATEIRRVLDLLDGRVEVAVLKGAALVGSLYRDFSERQMWDVDLLAADAESRDRAAAMLKEAGFETGKDVQAHHHAPAVKDPDVQLGVEVHSNFVTPPLPDGLIHALWDRRRTGPCFTTLDPVGRVISHAIHALNDPMKSPLLRNLFETAWLTEQLSPGEVSELTELAARWGIDARLARALWLAHDIFGSPSIFPRPARSYLEHWCEKRLSWQGTLPFHVRVQRHLAHEHIRAIHRGAPARQLLPLLDIAATFAVQSIRRRLEASSHPPRRVDGNRIAVDGCIIFESADSGELHLLNAEAARTFETMRGDHAVIRELKRRGVFTSSPASRTSGSDAQCP